MTSQEQALTIPGFGDHSPMPDEMLSVCCGAPEHPDVEGMCGACNEWTGFEREEPDDPSHDSRAAGNPDPAPAVVEGTR